MAASDSELEAKVEDSLNTGLKSVKVRGRELEYHDIGKSIDALLKLRGLQSPNRGISVGRIQRPSA